MCGLTDGEGDTVAEGVEEGGAVADGVEEGEAVVERVEEGEAVAEDNWIGDDDGLIESVSVGEAEGQTQVSF